MKFSYGRFGSMKPKVVVFECRSITSERASAKTIRKVEEWFAEHEKDIKVYKMRYVTKKGWLGLWIQAKFYVYYKDIPR